VIYSNTAPIIGRGQASAAAIQAWFIALGPGYAPGYAPDKKYKAPPDDLGTAIINECRRYADQGIIVNHDITAGQIVNETAAWQSKYARERNNPGGIGAINSNPDLAHWFDTVTLGVRAHVAHLLTYAVGEGPWTKDTPRYQAVKNAGWVGVAPLWTGLNGRWASPGTTYGQGCISLGNRLLTFAATFQEPVMNPIIQGDNLNGVPFRVDILPTTNVNRKRLTMNSYAGPLIHDTGNINRGANAEMHRQFLRNGGGSENVAWHITVDDKEAIQHLPLNEGAWHAGNTACNHSRWGIEMCINEDGDFNKTMANAAKVVQFLWNYAPETNGKIGQHHGCSGKNCPARLRAGRWEEFLRLVNASTVRPPDPNAEMFILDDNAVWVVNTITEDGDDVRMLDFFREMGGVPRLGYPLSGMRLTIVGGKRVYTQEFENVLAEAWMQDFGNMPAPYYRFGRRLPL